MREAYASLVSSTVERIDEYLSQHPISDDLDECRTVWAIASYKLTHDPRYSSFLKVDWSSVDPEIFDADDDDDSLASLLDVEVERRLSFPWLFPDALFALLR